MRRDILLAGVAGAVIGSWLTLIVLQLGEHGFSLPGRSSNTMADNRPAPAPAPAETAKADLTPPKNAETPKPAETAKQDDAAASKPQPEDQAKTQPAKPATEMAPDKVTPTVAAPASPATPDGSSQLSEAAVAAAAAATPAPTNDDAVKTQDGDTAKTEDNKVATAQPAAPPETKAATDPAQSSDASAKPGEAQPVPATSDAAKSTETAAAEIPKPADVTPEASSATPASPQAAGTDQAKADPAPDNRIPADQIDRELAASAHRTLPPQAQPQPQPESQPQSEQASLGPAQKPQEQTTSIELNRPFSDQAGIVTIAGKSVRLVGIIPTDVDRMCTSSSGKDWPCGQAARTAFRMYLRGRSIDCDLPSATWTGTVTGACRYVRIDLSSWLVRFGWADPEPGSPLVALVDEAKQKKRGMYGDDPRKNGKSTLGPALPKEDPLNPI